MVLQNLFAKMFLPENHVPAVDQKVKAGIYDKKQMVCGNHIFGPIRKAPVNFNFNQIVSNFPTQHKKFLIHSSFISV